MITCTRRKVKHKFSIVSVRALEKDGPRPLYEGVMSANKSTDRVEVMEEATTTTTFGATQSEEKISAAATKESIEDQDDYLMDVSRFGKT